MLITTYQDDITRVNSKSEPILNCRIKSLFAQNRSYLPAYIAGVTHKFW